MSVGLILLAVLSISMALMRKAWRRKKSDGHVLVQPSLPNHGKWTYRPYNSPFTNGVHYRVKSAANWTRNVPYPGMFLTYVYTAYSRDDRAWGHVFEGGRAEYILVQSEDAPPDSWQDYLEPA